MTTEHTPGPWTVVPDPDEEGRLLEISAPCHEHPDCAKTIVFGSRSSLRSSTGPNTMANAYLIAAAPDLLAALRAILTDSPETGFTGLTLENARAAHAAIAKAEGR